jgi:hypothetical protein
MHRWAITLLVTAALVVPASVLAQEESYSVPGPGNAPVLGRSAIVQVTEGRVLVRLPDEERYRALSSRLESVPMGSFIDARRGRLRIRVMRRADSERTWAAEFYGGKFQITQQTDAPYVTDLRLAGGFSPVCSGDAAVAAAAKKKKRKRVRSLWGDGKGRFRTSGRYSAATVRGTWWLVEDRCDGTLTRVVRGEVDVEDYSDQPAPDASPKPDSTQPQSGGGSEEGTVAPVSAPRERSGRKVRVKRGRSYLAKPGG